MSRTYRVALLFAVLALLVPVLAACGGNDDDDDDNGNGAVAPTATATVEPDAEEAPDEVEAIQVGYVPVLIYGPVIIADGKGYFEEQGIDAELQPLAGGADLVTQTASGNFDIGIGGAGPAFFNAINRGIELKVIAPLHFERTPQATPLMVSKERYDSGELDSIAKLEGKRVSVNARGATEYWLDQALRTAGLTIEDIDLQELAFPDVPAALESGALDAAMLGEPLATQAERDGIAVRLADDFIADFQPTFVFVNPEFAEENPDLVTGFMAGFMQGCRDLIGDDWNSEENLEILNATTNVPIDLISESARTYCEPNGEVDVNDLQALQEFFGERGLLDYEEMLDVETIIDRTYAESALEEIGRYEE